MQLKSTQYPNAFLKKDCLVDFLEETQGGSEVGLSWVGVPKVRCCYREGPVHCNQTYFSDHWHAEKACFQISKWGICGWDREVILTQQFRGSGFLLVANRDVVIFWGLIDTTSTHMRIGKPGVPQPEIFV